MTKFQTDVSRKYRTQEISSYITNTFFPMTYCMIHTLIQLPEENTYCVEMYRLVWSTHASRELGSNLTDLGAWEGWRHGERDQREVLHREVGRINF